MSAHKAIFIPKDRTILQFLDLVHILKITFTTMQYFITCRYVQGVVIQEYTVVT